MAYWEKIDKRVFPVPIVGESHTIPASSSYTVRIREVPFDETPSTVSITEDGGAGVFTETTGTPGDWEFVINYDNGVASFNGNQASMAILVDYKGTGSFVFNEDINDLQDDVILNNAHRISDGKDHSDVVLNNSHRGTITGNPHNLDNADVGLGNVPNLDTTDAVNNEHTHSNKVQLDLVTDGDHDISDGTSHSEVVLNNSHRINTANPHNTDIGNLGTGTLAELNSKVTDATLDDVTGSRPPDNHAANHVGADSIQNASNSQKGLATASHITDIESNNAHRGVITGNPHVVTKSEVTLGNVTDNAQVKKISSNTDNNVPQWDGTAGDLLKNGYPVETTLAGSPTKLARADAIKDYIDIQVGGNPISSYDNVLTVGGTLGEYTDLWSAIVAATSSDVIYVFPGTWNIGANVINQDKDITIVGVGNREHIIITSSLAAHIFNSGYTHNYTFENVKIVGNVTYGLQTTGDAVLIVENCQVDAVIKMNNGNGQLISNSNVTEAITPTGGFGSRDIYNSTIYQIILTSSFPVTLNQVKVTYRISVTGATPTIKLYGRTYVEEYNANVASLLHIYGALFLGASGLTGTTSPTITRYGGIITKLDQDLDANGKQITSLGTTTNPNDAATKAYVDGFGHPIGSFTNVITVGGANAEYTTLDSAIAAATSNDVILVYPGTYTIVSTINADKDLNIYGMGASPEDVYINREGSPLFDVPLNKHYTIKNCHIRSSSQHAIRCNPSNSKATLFECKVTGWVSGAHTSSDVQLYRCDIDRVDSTNSGNYLVSHSSIAELSLTGNIRLRSVNIVSWTAGTSGIAAVEGNVTVENFNEHASGTINIENGAILGYENRSEAGFPTVNRNGAGQILKLAQDMDANSKKIISLGAPTAGSDAARLADVFPKFQLFADQLDNPNSADWAQNYLAPAAADSNNAGLSVRLFDDGANEEGVGFIIEVPTGATNIVISLKSRAETGAASNLDVQSKIYVREVPDNGAVESWDAGTNMTVITMGTSNEYFQYDSQSITLGSLSITAGNVVQFELTRDADHANDTLVGDWTLLEVNISFT